jgi:alkyl hydroperoxide reductase subunit AhpF
MRCFNTNTNVSQEEENQREQMDYDVLIVGGGPAGKFRFPYFISFIGLATAIRLK